MNWTRDDFSNGFSRPKMLSLETHGQLDLVRAILMDLLHVGREVNRGHDSGRTRKANVSVAPEVKSCDKNAPVSKLLLDDGLQWVSVNHDDWGEGG